MFNTIYNNHLLLIEEGKFKNMAMAGALAGSLIGSPPSYANPQNRVNPIIRQAPDSVIIGGILPFTKDAEGFSDSMYIDSEGVPTIGYGTSLKEWHNVKMLESLGYDVSALKRRGVRISTEHAEFLLKKGLEQALRDARYFCPNFDEQPLMVKKILTDMSYNLGLTKLMNFNEFRRGLMARDYEYAKKHMIDSKWYKQVGRRSKALVKMMEDVIRMEKSL